MTELNELKVAISIVCYDSEVREKMGKVWDKFFALEEALTTPPRAEQKGICNGEGIIIEATTGRIKNHPTHDGAEVMHYDTHETAEKRPINADVEVEMLQSVPDTPQEAMSALPTDEQIEENGKEGGLRDNELQMFWEGAVWMRSQALHRLAAKDREVEELPLPEFLYEDDGEIFIGWHGDTVCTQEWTDWVRCYALHLAAKRGGVEELLLDFYKYIDSGHPEMWSEKKYMAEVKEYLTRLGQPR